MVRDEQPFSTEAVRAGPSPPMPVVPTGVIGGTRTHGLVGLFLGPVVLSVSHALAVAWTRLGEPLIDAGDGAPPSAAPGVP